VSSAVANAVPSLGDAVLAKLRPELSSAISASSSDLQALVDRRLTESSTALKTDFDTKLARLRGDVSGVITKEVGKQLAIELQPVNTSITDLTAKSAASSAAIADLTSKTDANAGALTTLNASVNTVGERIDSVAAAEGRARLALEKSLRTEITKVKFPASPP
jgi:methyl-accepting chemotaxis protein